MAIARDATSSTPQTNASSKTWAHTCSGSDRLLLVGIQVAANNSVITGVTYDGVALSKVDGIDWPGGAVGSSAIYKLVNPSAGTHNIVVTLSTSCYVDAYGVSYTGVDQTAPIDSHATSTSNTPSTTVGASNCWTVAHISSSSGATVSYNSGTNPVVYNWGNADGVVDSNGTVSTGSQSLGISQAGSPSYRATIVSIAPAATPTAPTVDTLAATDITTTTATLNGEITDVGSGDATARGFVYGTSTHSDPGDVAPASSGYTSYTTESGTFGAATFSDGVTGLAASTTYYVRAWAQNAYGYAYGDEVSFSTSATPPFRFTNLPGIVYDETDTYTIYAERLNDILERLEALEG